MQVAFGIWKVTYAVQSRVMVNHSLAGLRLTGSPVGFPESWAVFRDWKPCQTLLIRAKLYLQPCLSTQYDTVSPTHSP